MKRSIIGMILAVLVSAAAFCTPVLAAETESSRDTAIALEFPYSTNVSQITSLQFQTTVENVSETAAVSVDFAESLREENQVIARSTYHDGILTVYIASANTLLGEEEQTLPIGKVVADDPSGTASIKLQLIPGSLQFLNGMDGAVDLAADSVHLISSLTADGETPKGDGTTPSTAVDKETLAALIEECGKLRKTDYTAKSWEAFASSLKAAKAVFADENATQAKVDATVADLLKAYDGLQHAKDGGGTTNETTKDGIRKALTDLLKELDALVSADYTDDSWNKLYVLMEQARAMLKSDDASKEELKDILDRLRAAQQDLVRNDAAGETTAPKGKENGSKTNAPQTGDTRNPIIWIVLGAAGGACAVAAIVILIIRKKKS